MGVVVAKYPFAVRFVQRQAVTNSIRKCLACFHPPHLNLDPVAVALIDDLVMQVEEGVDPGVVRHALVYQQLIKFR